MIPSFAEIEKKRQAANIAAYALCKKASVSPNTYYRLRTGGYPAKVDTLRRLADALEGRPTAKQARPSNYLISQHFRLVLTLVAQAAGVPAVDAIAADPHANRPRDQDWLVLVRLRQIAIYIVSTEGNVSGAEMARVLKMSKQAVSKACRKVELLRDRPKFEALLSRVKDLLKDPDKWDDPRDDSICHVSLPKWLTDWTGA